MTGGYLDPKKIKLDIYNNIREQKKQKEHELFREFVYVSIIRSSSRIEYVNSVG